MYTIASTNIDELKEMRNNYYCNLIAPMDDFWEEGMLPSCQFYSIKENDIIGFFSLDQENVLNQFFLNDTSKYIEVLKIIILKKEVKRAYVSSYDPLLLEAVKKLSIKKIENTLLYMQNKLVSPIKPFEDIENSIAQDEDLERAVEYSNKVGIGGEWIIGYYQKIMRNNGLIIFTINNDIIGTGEIRPSISSKEYANIGVTVSPYFRRKGIATYIINTIREIANKEGYTTICSTTIGNIGSQKTLNKSGFKAYHKIFEFQF